MAAPPAWVAALPSDDEEDDGVWQNRKFAAAGQAASAEGDMYVVEDDDLQVLNVMKHEQRRSNTVPLPTAKGEFLDGPSPVGTLNCPSGSNSYNGGGEVYHFTATKAAVHEGRDISHKWRRKHDARHSRRILKHEIFGGVPASQSRREGVILGGDEGSSSQSRERDLVGREAGPWSAPPATEMMQMVQAHTNGSSDRQQYSTNLAPGLRFEGPLVEVRVPRPTNLQRALTGNTMSEWWSTLQANVGREPSLLHWDIMRFCRAYKLTPQQMQVRTEALDYVERAVHEIWPHAEVQLFGSTATDLALPWSDIDVAVMSTHEHETWPKPTTLSLLSSLGKKLKKQGLCQSLREIPFAKVPILKVVFKSGLACDISFDSHNGPRSVPVIRQFMQEFDAARPLCLVLKFFLGQHYLNEVYTGGLGSFCLISMVVSHLQKLGLRGAGHDLGAVLLSFFTRYSTMHNFKADVVSTRTDYCASKEEKGWVNINNPELLAVEDPLDPTSDIGRSSYQIEEVRKKFLKAQRVLLTHWYQENVLSQIVDITGDPQQRPKPPAWKSQVTRQVKQRKRKKRDFVVGHQEDGQPVQDRKRRKLNPKHSQQGNDLVHKRCKKSKHKKKKTEKRSVVDVTGDPYQRPKRPAGKSQVTRQVKQRKKKKCDFVTGHQEDGQSVQDWKRRKLNPRHSQQGNDLVHKPCKKSKHKKTKPCKKSKHKKTKTEKRRVVEKILIDFWDSGKGTKERKTRFG